MPNFMHSPFGAAFQKVRGSPLEFRRRGGGSFDIASTNPSAYYDRTVLATLFQDSAGTTPVTAVSQPIGLGLDQSQGLVLGSNVLTGDFSSTTGWTISAQCSINTITQIGRVASSDGSYQSITRSTSLVAGLLYEVRVNVTEYVSGNLRANLAGNGTLCAFPAGTGVRTGYIRANTTGTFSLNFDRAAGVTDISFEAPTVRELPGNHQSQATAGNRPLLSSRVNLLTYSEDFTNAAWTPARITIAGNSTTAPDGTLTADSFVTTTGTTAGEQYSRRSATVSANQAVSFYVKKNNWRYISIRSINYSIVDLDTNSVTLLGAGETVTVEPIADSWVRITTVNGSSGSAQIGIGLAFSGTLVAWIVPVDGTSVYVWGAQLDYGPTAQPYQWITTATNYDTVGFPTYADFDANDELITTFPASLGAGCTVCRSLPGTGASITTGVTLTATFTDNVDAHFLAIYTAAQWAALDAGQIANITKLLNQKAGL